MFSVTSSKIYVLLLAISQSLASISISYNQPNLPANATWDANATTFANSSTVGSSPGEIFINNNNTVFVSSLDLNKVLVWSSGSVTPTKYLSGGLNSPRGLFVVSNGDVYVDNGAVNHRVEKWAWNASSSVPVMNITSRCWFAFVDINNTLYCSLDLEHKVIKMSLNDNSHTVTIAAGNGSQGAGPYMLYNPNGLFIDTNFVLYVADYGNQRIQLFQLGQLNGTTVSTGSFTLNSPVGIILDGNGYLFISEFQNHRIIGSGPTGFRCVIGCAGGGGNAANQLNHPQSLRFDSFGNLFIVDYSNARIQKFLLTTQFSGQATTTALGTTVDQATTTALGTTAAQATTTALETTVDQATTTALRTTVDQATTTAPGTTAAQATTTALRTTVDQATTTAPGTTAAQATTTALETTVDQATTRIQNDQSTMRTIITSPKIPMVNQSCFAPKIILIPGGSTLSSPMQFRRNQDFFISSNIQLQCNNSLATTTRWIIKNCTSNCSFSIQLDQSVVTTVSELFIPARTLPFGIYELTITVTMIASRDLTSSSSAYVRITPSGITANLVQLGTSMITRGYEQNLTLDPGSFSVDLDGYVLNASDWKYEYYCRIYDGIYTFPNLLGFLLTIDDPTIDPLNPSCLFNRSVVEYSPSKSSLTIFSHSFQVNRTYQFMVRMENRRNSSLQATGYSLVRVHDTHPQMIAVACVISTMCVANLEFQLVNPTTQIALFSLCLETYTSIQSITWNIYQGYSNASSSSVVHWLRFNQTDQYQNIWFFGTNTSNFTAINRLFLENPRTEYWRFEVVYSFPSETSSSSINFVINQPPQNGSCAISPLNGTTSTLFTISCPDWSDRDGIKDYSFYTWTTDRSKLLTISFTSMSAFQVRLPAGNEQTFELHSIVHIRDTLYCITEWILPSVTVMPDKAEITHLIDDLQNSANAINANPLAQLLASGNQNTIGQLITSLSQTLNQMNSESLENAVSGGIPAATISISSLESESSQSSSAPWNESAWIELNKQLNIQANVREYLMSFATNLLIATSNSIKLQASSLAQLTQTTNQLTRKTASLASYRCYQLALALHSMAIRIPYEDVLSASTQITECTNNVMTAINGPLQQRTSILNFDSSRANTFPDDYDTDLESQWSNLNLFADGNDFSAETIEKNRNIFFQKQTAKQISDEVKQTIALLTAALNIHLNIGQNLTMNSSSVFMSLETGALESLSRKLIKQVGNAQIQIPENFKSNLTNNQTVSFRSIMQPLASADQSKSQSNMNLSRSISFSVLDENGNEVSIQTNRTNPIELIIPRDPNLIIPPMIIQNVTSTAQQQLFNLHYVNITSTLPISVHIEIHPINVNIGYLFISKFDGIPRLNSSVQEIDGWTLFCPSNLTNETIYQYFLDNEQTLAHRSMVFGLRELNIWQVCSNQSISNPPITNERLNFTSNYELRVYSSGCYYLDENNQWQSDGLKVGPLTNHYQTQYFSTHLTTFATEFLVLPSPVDWNYVFSNADLIREKTVYFTVICVSIISLLFIVYMRSKGKEDLRSFCH